MNAVMESRIFGMSRHKKLQSWEYLKDYYGKSMLLGIAVDYNHPVKGWLQAVEVLQKFENRHERSRMNPFIAEKAKPGETWEQTAQRALKEEAFNKEGDVVPDSDRISYEGRKLIMADSTTYIGLMTVRNVVHCSVVINDDEYKVILLHYRKKIDLSMGLGKYSLALRQHILHGRKLRKNLFLPMKSGWVYGGINWIG